MYRASSNPPARAGVPAPAHHPGLHPGGLDVRHLAVLQRIARLGSFAAAADALHFTPSAISHQMAQLERGAGLALFERLPRGTRLTAAGRALLAHAEAVLSGLEDADGELRSLLSGESGHLRVGSFPTATAGFVAAALRTLQARFPKLTLGLVDGEPYESAARLKANELDVAILFELDSWPAGTDYESRPLCAEADLVCEDLVDDPFLLVMPCEHRLASLAVCTLDQLDGEVVVGSPTDCPPWGADLRIACRLAAVEPTFEDAYRTVDFQALQSIVASGRGVSLMPALALSHLRADLCARPLLGAPVRHVRLARLASARTSAPAAALGDVLREACRRGTP